MGKTVHSLPHAEGMYAVEVCMNLWVLDLMDKEPFHTATLSCKH